MLTNVDSDSLRGITIVEAEIHDRDHGQVLRLHLTGGGILALSATPDGLNLADESAMP